MKWLEINKFEEHLVREKVFLKLALNRDALKELLVTSDTSLYKVELYL